MTHIKDELEELLLKDGWIISKDNGKVMFEKFVNKSHRSTILTINKTGKWFESSKPLAYPKGFNSVKLVDLRDYWGNAQGAIDEVLKK